MRKPSLFDIVFWAAAVAVPLVACALIVPTLPDAVPLHWGPTGIDRWGSPSDVWPLGIAMAGLNAILFVFFLFNDWLYDHGLVHGVSREGALTVCRVGAVIVAALSLVLLMMVAMSAR